MSERKINIEVLRDNAVIVGHGNEYSSIITLGNSLGVIDGIIFDGTILESLEINESEVFLKKFWAGKFCQAGGIKKKEFIDIQLLVWNLRESAFSDSIVINVHGKRYYPNIKELQFTQFGYDDKKMIKKYKRMYQTSVSGCPYYKYETKDNHSKLCCLCGNKDILILRGNK